MTSRTSAGLGQMSASMTGRPSSPMPSGSLVRSTSTRPANANATTSGGEARYEARTSGWIRPSKLRLPDRTAATISSSDSIAVATGSASGPELPMQVVQP